MVYQRIFNKEGKFVYASHEGATVFVRDLNNTNPQTPTIKYNPNVNSKAAEFLGTNPNLSDIPPNLVGSITTNWTGVINGLLTNTNLWNIISRYEGLNLSPRKRLSARSTELILLRLPELTDEFITGWNSIIAEIQANLLVQKPTPAEIADLNSVLVNNNAPFRFNSSTGALSSTSITS